MAEKLAIFISGTMRDLPEERERVAAAIRGIGLEPVWAEKRGATDRPSCDECERMARTCHVYLGLYGLSYGWKFPPEGTLSATEFEWQTAKRAGKPMLIYRQKGDPDPEQAAFLKRVGDWQQGRFWYEFETLDDLLPRLRDDLARLIAENFRPEQPALLAEYRAHLRRLYADLPLAGIPVPLDVTLPLDRVYIKLRALPEREEALRREDMLPSDREEELSRRLAEHLWQQRGREELEEGTLCLEEMQPIPPEEAAARHDHLAIVGEAGSGKSTLLRHLAWERASDPKAPLPLLIPLGRADALISQTGCSFLEAALDLLTEHKAGEEKELLKRTLADAIRDKNVLFLCDGLDEAHLGRRSVVAGLEKLAADGQRLVVTSRPQGYERLPALEHFQVLPLLPEDAEAFSDRWFRALAATQGVPDTEREGWAAERADWLQRQLDERPGLREVAKNPLLLTFLAMLAGDEPQRDLPPRRKELYREYVERLFTVWETRRQREGELSLGSLRGEEARRVALWGLYRTAWHLHQAYYGGEGPRAVRGEIEPLLARDLAERWEFGLLQAEALAAEVLRFWERAGLLDVYRLAGQEWLAFRHLTFQEYGAARALAEMYENDADGLWQCFSPHLLRLQWDGVISLTIAHLPNATLLVKRLLTADVEEVTGLPRFVARWDLPVLACRCLMEGCQFAGNESAIAEALSDVFRQTSEREFWDRECRLAIVYALKALGLPTVVPTLVEASNDYRLWEAALDALISLGQRAVQTLLGRATEWQRFEGVATALARICQSDPQPLLVALHEGESLDQRCCAALALGMTGLPQAVEALITLYVPQADANLRWYIVRGLAVARNPQGFSTLVAALEDPVGDVRSSAVWGLARLRGVDTVPHLIKALGHRDEYIRAGVAEELGRLGDRRATQSLCEVASSDSNRLAREYVVYALGQIGDSRAVETLVAALGDVNPSVRYCAVTALDELGQATPEVLAALRALAEEPEASESVRRAVREALERLEG